MIRTTNLTTSDTMLNYIMTNQAKYNEAAEMSSSGKKLTQPSDNAYDAISVLNVNKQLSQLDGYVSNMKLGTNELNVLDQTEASITTQLQRANDLAIEASNQANSPEALSNIKIEIDQIIQNLKSLGNTNYNGSYIFAGTQTSTAPFQDVTDASGNVTGMTYTGTPADKAYQRYIQISENVVSPINVPGDTLLGSYDPVTKTGQGVFKTLSELSEALGAQDTTTIRNSIDQIQSGLNDTANTRTKFGSIVQRFDMTQASIASTVLQLKDYKSSLADVDLSEAATQLASQKIALQATLSVAAQTLQGNSLLNYL